MANREAGVKSRREKSKMMKTKKEGRKEEENEERKRETGEKKTGRSSDKSSQSVTLKSAGQSRISLTKFLCTSRTRQSVLGGGHTVHI